MGGTSEKSLKKKQKMEMFMEYTKKIFNMLHCFNSRRSTDQTAAVLCDELFKPAKKRHVDDPVLSPYIAAQNYFTVRPNIYL
ncbi:hypothetical protein QJS04_geneDACA008060 [Acorus gramineus]|uniref:Uncharacterized protein n=1 Tax=Acorus gramineus TaxID=55184 RepID=A0AAV9BC16_ACOGR|nr:hypothetical protein QJS04_geneDACA008060 [Acorus gramineus]